MTQTASQHRPTSAWALLCSSLQLVVSLYGHLRDHRQALFKHPAPDSAPVYRRPKLVLAPASAWTGPYVELGELTFATDIVRLGASDAGIGREVP
jgi:hypothetical protein